MRARIDISEVEIRTKIRAKYLRAIENEEWDLLPGPVYVKSFLRTYGDFLGLDSRLLVDDYKRRYERPSDNELRPIATLSRERERYAHGPLIPPRAIIGLVLLAIVVVLFIVGKLTIHNPSASPPGVHATGTRRPSHHKAHRNQPTTTTTTTTATPATVKLELVPTGQVYVCVVDGTGKKLIPGTIFSAGQTIPTQTAAKLLLNLGNASVRMKVNGAAVSVPASPNPIGYLLTPSGASSLPASQRPTCA